MGIWIRTQNKVGLFQVNAVMGRDCSLVGMVQDGGSIILGKYESEKRVIQILDDIQKMIEIKLDQRGKYEELDILIKSKILCNMSYVYQLPEK